MLLRQDLCRTRERGYAIDHGENEDGSYCVGAPIFEVPGKPMAALSVSAPASRLNEMARHDIVAALLVATSRISLQVTAGSRLVNR